MRKNPNFTNYHYRSEVTHKDGSVETKYYHTLQQICDEYQTSTFTIYRMMHKDIQPRSHLLHNVKFFKDYKPAYVLVKNEEILG